MKDDHIDICRMIMQSHYQYALELEDNLPEGGLSEMERKDYMDIIRSQHEAIEDLKTLVRSLERNLTTMETCKDQEISELKRTISELIEKNNRLNKDLYGRKSQSNRHKNTSETPKKSRAEEKEDCDGSDKGSGSSPNSAAEGNKETPSQPTDLKRDKVKSEYLDGTRSKRGKYTLMDAARVVEHKTKLMRELPEGWRYIYTKGHNEFTRVSYIECHQYQIAVYEDEFGIRHEYYEAENAQDTYRPHVNTIQGTHCTAELLTDMIMDGYLYHLPNHRSNSKMQYEDFQVSENTRKNWLRAGSRILEPLLKHLKKEILKVKNLLNIDETWCKVRVKFRGDGRKLGKYLRKYIWVIVNKHTSSVYFLYDNEENDSRGSRPIQQFLGDYAGAIQSDGYTVYKHLVRENAIIIHLLCWAHVRSKFKYAEEVAQDKMASWFVSQIGRLYLVEAECVINKLTADEVCVRRNKRDVSKILASLKSKAEELLNRSRVHYGETMRKALTYMLNGWNDLIKYRDKGDYTIDNLLAERAIRPVTVNRKNSCHYGSEEGVVMAIGFHSLIETGKMRGLHIKNWLRSLLRGMIQGNKDYEGLLQGTYCTK